MASWQCYAADSVFLGWFCGMVGNGMGWKWIDGMVSPDSVIIRRCHKEIMEMLDDEGLKGDWGIWGNEKKKGKKEEKEME